MPNEEATTSPKQSAKEKGYPVCLPEASELNDYQKKFLIEHYRKCNALWRHWTPTIWSIPSVAAAINAGAYAVIFDSSRDLEPSVRIAVLGLLLFLNLALTLGIWKHRYMQKVYGERILVMDEKYALVERIPFSKPQAAISGSFFYFMAMVAISSINLMLFVTWILYFMRNMV